MLKGFKDFLMRGNIVELGVAFVIGVAFTTLVKSFTDHFINPLIATIGGTNVDGFTWRIIDENAATTINFGAIITAVITFVLTAAVVYFAIVVPYNKLQERRKASVEEAEAEPTDTELLAEIRDLLRSEAAR